jgi:tRNA (cmo5U34)-methyltransferase
MNRNPGDEVQRRSKQGFNRLSPIYDFSCWLFFGNKLFQSQVYFLPKLKEHRRILILGGGTGRFLHALLCAMPQAHICYVDISESMISRSRNRITEAMPSALERVDFVCGSIDAISPTTEFDLIVTPFVLDCFPPKELTVLMNQLNNFLSPAGIWLFADFCIPTRGYVRSLAQIVTRSLYVVFNLVCGLGVWRLPDFQSEFTRIGFFPREEMTSAMGLLQARLYSRRK